MYFRNLKKLIENVPFTPKLYTPNYISREIQDFNPCKVRIFYKSFLCDKKLIGCLDWDFNLEKKIIIVDYMFLYQPYYKEYDNIPRHMHNFNTKDEVADLKNYFSTFLRNKREILNCESVVANSTKDSFMSTYKDMGFIIDSSNTSHKPLKHKLV